MDVKGLSQVVSAVAMIAITFAVVVVLANTTNIFVKDKLEESQSCFELFDQVKINDDYTCYNLTNESMQVSLIVEDVDILSILVAVSMNTKNFVFTLENSTEVIENVSLYPNRVLDVSMPAKQGGKTYIIDGIDSYPESIEIAPETEKTRCEVLDKLETIPVC